MTNLALKIPSWKSGIIKRFRSIPSDQIIQIVCVIVYLGMMAFITIVMIQMALNEPPTMEFSNFTTW